MLSILFGYSQFCDVTSLDYILTEMWQMFAILSQTWVFTYGNANENRYTVNTYMNQLSIKCQSIIFIFRDLTPKIEKDDAFTASPVRTKYDL